MFNSRFKHYLIPIEELPGEARRLEPLLKGIQKSLENRDIDEPEAVFRILIAYLSLRSKGAFWMKTTRTEPLPIRNANDILNCGLAAFSQNYQIKKLPGGVLNVLTRWQLGEVRLHFCEEPPSPQKLLNLQAQGERVVTFNFDKANGGECVDGRRDSFEFLLHDLVHADLFFHRNFTEQKKFFRQLLDLVPELDPLLSVDSELQSRVFYVMADMNSHPEHMRQSLRASLIDHYKKVDSSRTLLLPEQEIRIDQILSRIQCH
jgi:hypothetical protein